MFVIRYGDEAGQAADTAVQSAVNVGITAFNVDNLGIKVYWRPQASTLQKQWWKTAPEEKESRRKKSRLRMRKKLNY